VGDGPVALTPGSVGKPGSYRQVGNAHPLQKAQRMGHPAEPRPQQQQQNHTVSADAVGNRRFDGLVSYVHASAPLRRSSCPGPRGARTLVAVNTPRYWYTAKQWPFGHRLAQTWEGWLVDLVWIATSLGISPLLRKDSQYPVQGLGLMFGLMAVFIAIRSWKGAPKRWDG